MARALFATALAPTSVAVIALVSGLGYPWSGPLELFGPERVLRRAVRRIGVAVSSCCAWATPNGARHDPPLQADSTLQRFGLVRARAYRVVRSTRQSPACCG